MKLIALFRLGFPTAPVLLYLNLASHRNSQVHYAKGTPSGCNSLRPLVSSWFQVLFHSPPGGLFTVPSRYYSLSVAASYLALQGGPRRFKQGFSCPALLRNATAKPIQFHLQDCHLLWWPFPEAFCYRIGLSLDATVSAVAIAPFNTHAATPDSLHYIGLGSSPFARRY